MRMSVDPIALARQLINCPSVTPARGEVFDLLEAALKPLGFEMHRWVMGEPPDGPTENMVAIRGDGSPHFGFAGHLDVVPAGEGWRYDPFEGAIEDGLLIGRGANDMKSAIAAFVAAISRIEQTQGTLSLLITGDEEGYATYGTPRIIDWLNARSIRPDMILIGEPTSVDRLGDTVKIGRRGSATAQLNIRFNNLHRGADLVGQVEAIAEREAPGSKVTARISGEAFLTPPGPLYDVVVSAIEEVTGLTPDLSTSGGTSDGRFLIQLCPVVDFGLPNATMHKVGECAAVEDIRALSRIYERILRKVIG